MEDKIREILKKHYTHLSNTTLIDATTELLSLLPKWIPVSERLPETEGQKYSRDILCMDIEGAVFVGVYSQIFKQWTEVYTQQDYEVTHWMPLPNLPEVK